LLPGSTVSARLSGLSRERLSALARNCRLPRWSDFVRYRRVNWRSAGVTARTVRGRCCWKRARWERRRSAEVLSQQERGQISDCGQLLSISTVPIMPWLSAAQIARVPQDHGEAEEQ